jgi:hypothetical protein
MVLLQAQGGGWVWCAALWAFCLQAASWVRALHYKGLGFSPKP